MHAIGKDEKIKLQKGIAVRYLLKAGELEKDYRHTLPRQKFRTT